MSKRSKSSRIQREEHGPPSQVLIQGSSQQGVSDDLSAVSSMAPTRCTARLEALFREEPNKNRKFEPSSKLASFLSEQLKLDITFISKLAQIGLVTPSAVVNAFGLDNRTIAGSFAKMGASHVLDQQMYQQTQVLLMFARSQTLNFRMLRYKNMKQTWIQLKKGDKFDETFNSWKPDHFQKINDFIMDQSNIIIAQHEMREVRKIIRKWARNDACSIVSSMITNR